MSEKRTRLEHGVLGDIAEVVMGQSPPGSSYNRVGLGVPLINGPTEFTTQHPVPVQWTTSPTRVCETGDALICVRGSSTGRLNVADRPYCLGRGVAAIRASGANDQRFVQYALAAAVQHLLSLQTGSTFPSIDARAIRSASVLVPDPAEQRQMGAALTAVNDLVMALSRLIAKKEAVLEGLKQQLLTGQTRLHGFSTPWRKSDLGAQGDFLRGRGVKRSDVQGSGIPCVRYGELYTEFSDFTDAARSFVSPEVAKASLPLREGDILFAGSGETRDEIGTAVAYVGPTPAVAGGDIVVLRGDLGNPIFLAMLMNSHGVTRQKARAGQGDAVVHISARALADIRISLPDRDEQDAIARVLVDAVSEIETIRKRLAKARAVKLGMMQELLSGRTLPPVEVEAG